MAASVWSVESYTNGSEADSQPTDAGGRLDPSVYLELLLSGDDAADCCVECAGLEAGPGTVDYLRALVWGRLHAEQLIAGALANVEAGRGGQSRDALLAGGHSAMGE